MENFKVPSLEEVVSRMKSEILADMGRGIVPNGVSSFSELHDYVDANCYGGFCDDEYQLKLYDAFVKASCCLEPSEEVCALANAAQSAVNKWLFERATQHSADEEDARGYTVH